MGLYGFKPQFWFYVLDGSKRHTIRLPRKYPDKKGSTMHLRGNVRQKNGFLLLRAACLSVRPIVLEKNRIEMDGSKLKRDERDLLAWQDGFRPAGSSVDNPGHAFKLMSEFWRGSMLPLVASINYWSYPPLAFGARKVLLPRLDEAQDCIPCEQSCIDSLSPMGRWLFPNARGDWRNNWRKGRRK